MRTYSEWCEFLLAQAICYARCLDDAEDLVQDTLLAYRLRFGVFPWEAEDLPIAKIWCRLKLRGLAIDASRRSERQNLSLNALPADLDLCNQVSNIIETVDFNIFLEKLPLPLKEILNLLLEGYSCEEIAKQLGVTSVKVRYWKKLIRCYLVQFL